MYKIGLKLWSINTDYYYDEAIRLYNNGVYDYIELYVVPNTTDTIEKWKKLDIPFTLHAPHFAHDVNLACKDKLEYNKKIYNEVAQFEKELKPKFTVVHGGIEGTVEELVRQLKIIRPKNILIENKPYRVPLGEKKLCRGYNIKEIKYVLDNYGCGFCLDIGHAICSANSLSLEPYGYISEFNELNPICYHLSDGYIDSPVDKHLHIGSGTYDINKILNIIGNKKTISIETNKDSKVDLEDFRIDVEKIYDLSK